MALRKADRLGSPLRLVAAAVVVAAVATSLPAIGARGFVVHAEVRRPGTTVSIAASTIKPYGVAYLKGQRLKIECINASRVTRVSFTYSLLCPVCVDYVPAVQLRGKLPNGQRRWVAIVAWQGVTLAMNVTTTAASGPCGANPPDTISIPSPNLGYLLVA